MENEGEKEENKSKVNKTAREKLDEGEIGMGTSINYENEIVYYEKIGK